MTLASPGPPGSPRPLLRSPWRRKNLRVQVLGTIAVALGVLVLAEPTGTSLAVGGLVLSTGLGLRGWAAGHLVKTERLAVSGPYRFLRHPLYAGTLGIEAGLILASGFGVARFLLPLALAHFFFHYLPYKERAEARRLEDRHGAAFAEYRAAVPALLPRLQPWPGGDPSGAWRFERVVENDEIGTAVVSLLYLGALALKAL